MTMPQTGLFTALDWFLVVIILLSTLLAFRRGLIRVLFSFGGLIAGVLLASWNHAGVAGWLHQWITGIAVSQIVAFLLILVVVSVVFSVAGGVLRKTVKAVGLGLVDRLLGACFGFCRGVLLGVAAMMAFAAFVPDAEWLKHSQLSSYFLAGAHGVSSVVPEHFAQQISEGATHLLREAPNYLAPHTLTQHD